MLELLERLSKPLGASLNFKFNSCGLTKAFENRKIQNETSLFEICPDVYRRSGFQISSICSDLQAESEIAFRLRWSKRWIATELFVPKSLYRMIKCTFYLIFQTKRSKIGTDSVGRTAELPRMAVRIWDSESLWMPLFQEIWSEPKISGSYKSKTTNDQVPTYLVRLALQMKQLVQWGV